MPLPWLLLGALAGGIAHLNAGEKNDRAKKERFCRISLYSLSMKSLTFSILRLAFPSSTPSR